MTLWLLDTNMVSDWVRHPQGEVRHKVVAVGEANVLTSIVVACELRYGAAKRGSMRLIERIENILQELDIQPLGPEADRNYARLRCELERKGTPIGNQDMLIASHALALDANLVTANTREFARIEELKLENWLA